MLQSTFIGEGRAASQKPDPRYPLGCDLDLSNGAARACSVALRYPAPEVGRWLIECLTCGRRVVVTAAGRIDDPRKIKVPCRGASDPAKSAAASR